MPAARRFAQDIINGRDMEEKNDKPTIITRDGAFCYDSVVELSKKTIDDLDHISKKGQELSAIDSVLDKYSNIPSFVLPYYHARCNYSLNRINAAVSCVDEAVSKLVKERPATENELQMCLWGLAGEIYANADRYADSANAYSRYLAMHFNIKPEKNCNKLLSFRPISKYSLIDIINKEITVSHPKVMNDPFDTIYLQWLDYYNQNNDKGRKHIKPMLEAMGNVRIRCFVNNQLDVTDSEPVSNILMWSHYADSHRGMCLEYRFSNKFMNQTNDDSVLRFRKVKYGPDALSIKSEQMTTDIGLLQKCNAWEYENEVRLISFAPNRKEDFIPIKLDDGSCVSRVFFGMNCPKRDIDTVRSILSDGKTEFCQMEKDWNNIYHLKYREI